MSDEPDPPQRSHRVGANRDLVVAALVFLGAFLAASVAVRVSDDARQSLRESAELLGWGLPIATVVCLALSLVVGSPRR